ncbi:hypothetical protein P43SY_012118 [Pythium insidiosum]|uniref:glucan endo-1,3-beta-D-glucosidase n=1 Tax=Pythium insidiosum TaxID=114742 RepID=A0AAD5LTQ3_PYTIN|nr:hypothetical protein P43SY_012118 [Pythium insidiosum]
MLRWVTASLAAAAVSALSAVDAALPAGVCYSPFHSPDYFNRPSDVEELLRRDFRDIAQHFSAVRTYHAQFYGKNVVHAAKDAGLRIAIGIQMLGPNGGTYAYLDQDVDAAITAAKTAPGSVLAIYAGNENLRNGAWGSQSADQIIEVIRRVKGALRGTAGEHVPVGTVQRINEWLESPDAGRLAAECDVVGANIYPFFTPEGEKNMKDALDRQWKHFAARFPGKARLTETGWPSQGSQSPQGNSPSGNNAQAYMDAFTQWIGETPSQSPFYFMMYDDASVHGPDFEKFFGVAADTGKLKVRISGGGAVEKRDHDEETPAPPTAAPTETPAATTPAPTTPEPTTPEPTTPEPTTPQPTTPEPTTPAPTTPEPTTAVPTSTPAVTPAHVAPKRHGSHSGSGSSADEITIDPSISFDDLKNKKKKNPNGSSSGSHGNGMDDSINIDDAGMVPAPLPSKTNQADAGADAAVVAPVRPANTPSPSELKRERDQAAREASSRVARSVSGETGSTFYAMAALIGFAGCAVIAIVAVYMRRRSAEEEETRTTRTVTQSTDARNSTPSVYNDPLGTRFSSIVMITPNGDGVCVL